MSKLYVGNCSFDITEQQLRDAFSGYGELQSVDGIELGGRTLTVNEAKPRPQGGGRGARRW